MAFTWHGAEEVQSNINVCKLFSAAGNVVPSNGTSGSRDCLCSVNRACKVSKDRSKFPIYTIPTPTERMCKQLCLRSSDCLKYTWYDESSFAKFQCFLYAACDEESEPCEDCHTGLSDCGNSCTELIVKTFSAHHRNINSKGTINIFYF